MPALVANVARHGCMHCTFAGDLRAAAAAAAAAAAQQRLLLLLR